MKHTFLQIHGNKVWRSKNKKVIKSSIVDINHCIDNHPPVGPTMFESEIVFFRNCDENQLYYWLNPNKFPKAKHIFIDSHYEPEVYNRFPQEVNIYITENVIEGRPWQKRINDHVNVGSRYVRVIKPYFVNLYLHLCMEKCKE